MKWLRESSEEMEDFGTWPSLKIDLSTLLPAFAFHLSYPRQTSLASKRSPRAYSCYPALWFALGETEGRDGDLPRERINVPQGYPTTTT
jgi:hypothetical protein